ncbi:heterokaryon incompatibility protein-domain-containing protein [Astrocystis sublimbata]|nr:heterokaryon incompatibility protein-domain-containing protein [Astrocystis sublimbata]
MGDVYSSAKCVIIWLGPADDQPTSPLFKYLRLLASSRHLDGPEKPRLGDREHQQAKLEQLVRLLENPWFSRIWTMQEVMEPGRCTVMCGSSTISWHRFVDAVRDAGADHHSSANALLVYLRGNLPGTSYPTPHPSDWLQRFHDVKLLKAMCTLQCRVPHDKIYGLHAILRARGLHLSPPDYNRPLSQVLEETARTYVQRRGKLDILRITLPPDETSGLPSWVPDWLAGVAISEVQCSDITGTVLVCFDDYPLQMSSCREALADATDGNSQVAGELRVKGKCIGTLKTVSAGKSIGAQRAGDHSRFHEFFPTCKEWCQMISSAKSYPTGEDPEVAGLWTVANARQNLGNNDPLHADHLRIWFRALLEHGTLPWDADSAHAMTTKHKDPRNSTIGAPEDLDIVRMVQTIVNYKANYAFFTLDSGYFGSAFRTCREGDHVYLLAGLDVPCILRPRDEGLSFVAIANVHGAMEGQLWPNNTDDLESLSLI